MDEKIVMTVGIAAFMGDRHAVKDFIKSGVDLDKKDIGGYAALHFAAQKGYEGIVFLLVEAGANPHLKTDNQETALDLAQKFGQVESAVVLEMAMKKAPLIKPEDLPKRVVDLEKTVEQLRKQIEEMTKKKAPSKASKKPVQVIELGRP